MLQHRIAGLGTDAQTERPYKGLHVTSLLLILLLVMPPSELIAYDAKRGKLRLGRK